MEATPLKLQRIYQNYSKVLLINIFLLATVMLLMSCFNFLFPIQGCYDLLNSNAFNSLNITQLESVLNELMARNWLYHHFSRVLIVGPQSIRAVMIMRIAGFPNAVGVDRKACASIVKRGSIYRLPFKANSFDFVFSMAMMDGVRVPAAMVMEIERVLKLSGVGVVWRRMLGPSPMRDMIKAAAPVASYLKASNIVDVYSLNHSVIVVVFHRIYREQVPRSIRED